MASYTQGDSDVNRRQCTRTKGYRRHFFHFGCLADVGDSGSLTVRWSSQISDAIGVLSQAIVTAAIVQPVSQVTRCHRPGAKTKDIVIILSRWSSFIWDS